MAYYSAIIFIEVFAALVMITLTARNPILDKDMRRRYSMFFGALVAVAISEWTNLFMNGMPESYRILHYIIKATEFSMVPMLALVGIYIYGDFKYKKALLYIDLIHSALEYIIAFTTRWIFYMDENNVYRRGQFYFFFVALYLIQTVILAWELLKCGRKFQNHNYVAAFCGAAFLISGIGVQLFDNGIRTSWLAVEMAFIMTYIYFNDMALQSDKLTGLLNRWCYERKLERLNYSTCILIFDVDSFKTINDTFGHLFGDESLRLAAGLIYKNFAKEGLVYRIGGDEFCVIMKKKSKYVTHQSDEGIQALIDVFRMEVEEAHKKEPRFTNISVGYAFTDLDFSINWALDKADRMMYEIKQKNKQID